MMACAWPLSPRRPQNRRPHFELLAIEGCEVRVELLGGQPAGREDGLTQLLEVQARQLRAGRATLPQEHSAFRLDVRQGLPPQPSCQRAPHALINANGGAHLPHRHGSLRDPFHEPVRLIGYAGQHLEVFDEQPSPRFQGLRHSGKRTIRVSEVL
jgi:hypothetical protein